LYGNPRDFIGHKYSIIPSLNASSSVRGELFDAYGNLVTSFGKSSLNPILEICPHDDTDPPIYPVPTRYKMV
jgi:hypothetical protein